MMPVGVVLMIIGQGSILCLILRSLMKIFPNTSVSPFTTISISLKEPTLAIREGKSTDLYFGGGEIDYGRNKLDGK